MLFAFYEYAEQLLSIQSVRTHQAHQSRLVSNLCKTEDVGRVGHMIARS